MTKIWNEGCKGCLQQSQFFMAYAATAKARKYIICPGTAGVHLVQEMADWAQKKMALYKNALIGMEPIKQNYLIST